MRCRRQDRRPVALLSRVHLRTCLMFITPIRLSTSITEALCAYYRPYIFSHQSPVDLRQYLLIFHPLFDFQPHFHSFYLWYHRLYLLSLKYLPYAMHTLDTMVAVYVVS